MKRKKTFFHILLHIGKMMDQVTTEELAVIGLHHGQGRTLVVLLENGDMTQANMARGMRVKSATITNMLKPLEKRKLISRYTDTKTNRAVVVTLTDEGERLAKEVIKIWAKIEQRLAAPFEGQETATLFAQLELFHDTLGGKVPKFVAYKK
ncbi:MAG: MarR family transcriptional regulator [Victivallaceae bacterium]|nr:MarR family transcriptional regulator [Victivallaceae bacterium]